MTIERRDKIISILSKRQLDVAVVIDNIFDPHNVGAILRSCDAFGIHRVYLSYTYQPMPRMGEIRSRSASSAVKWLDIQKSPDPMALIQTLKDEGLPIFTTHIGKQSVPPSALPLRTACAFVFGNEHEGVSEHWLQVSDANVVIPMQGFVESLNVSVAAAVCLYEVMRQRLSDGMVGPNAEADWMERWLQD